MIEDKNRLFRFDPVIHGTGEDCIEHVEGYRKAGWKNSC